MSAAAAPVYRVTQARVALSEWTKLRSVRSTLWALGVAMLLTAGLPLLVALVRSTRHPDRGGNGPSPLDIASVGVNVSQLAIAVLGVLFVTGEYSTGMIRSTFSAVPARLPVLWAKLGIYAVVSFVLMVPCVLVAFFGSQAILGRKDLLQVSFSDPGVARTVLGGALYLMLVGLFSLALGTIIRSTAGGISAYAAIFFVIPPLLNVLPTSWNNAIAPWLPDSTARAIFQLTHDSHSLSPGPGLAVFCGYLAFTIAVAAVLLRRRDT